MDVNPYPGAAKIILTKRERKAEKKAAKLAKRLAKKEKKQKIIKVKGKILCTCGELKKNYTLLNRYHADDCIINKENSNGV